MAKFVRAASLDDIPEGRAIVVDIEGDSLALARVDGDVYCIDNVCTHDGGPLGEGELDGTALECPRHGARFDVCTGRALSFPAVVPVNAYDVKIEGQDVLVDLG
ncbi:MAG: non-heme iron oxygenase ferredoxin subunit [Chloroflexi bacterium]|nr:non-heme iron oxygenase ferredoxin subunit [Chloroflexota bacterium]